MENKPQQYTPDPDESIGDSGKQPKKSRKTPMLNPWPLLFHALKLIYAAFSKRSQGKKPPCRNKRKYSAGKYTGPEERFSQGNANWKNNLRPAVSLGKATSAAEARTARPQH